MGKIIETITGKTPTPMQQHVLDVGRERLPDGKFAFHTVAWWSPRRGGKTTIGKGLVPSVCAAGGQVWMTAQNRMKARDRFLETGAEFERALNASKRRVRFLTGVGNESLSWLGSGGVLKPFAPNATSMHSETPDAVWADEVWAFDRESAADLRGAYVLGMLTTNGQEWLTSTAGTKDSGWYLDVQAQGRAAVEAGQDVGIAYFENSVPISFAEALQLPDVELLAVIAAHHPSYGFTFGMGELEQMLDRMKNNRPEFVRGMCNLTAGRSRPPVVPAGVWGSAATLAAPPTKVGVGAAVDPDTGEVAVVTAGRDEAGVAVVEVVQVAPGHAMRLASGAEVTAVGYLDALTRKQRPVATFLESSGADRDLADAAETAGVKVSRLTASDKGAAWTRFTKGIATRTVTYRRHPGLDAAVEDVDTAPAAGGRWWAKREAPDHVLRAATLAVWAADHPTGPTGRFRIGVPQ